MLVGAIGHKSHWVGIETNFGSGPPIYTTRGKELIIIVDKKSVTVQFIDILDKFIIYSVPSGRFL